MLSGRMPGLAYTGTASKINTTLHKAATHSGAKPRSWSTTPTNAHITIRMMITGGFSHTNTAPYAASAKPNATDAIRVAVMESSRCERAISFAAQRRSDACRDRGATQRRLHVAANQTTARS
jgi:hypothetical protein